MPEIVNPFAEIDMHRRRLPHWQQGNATQFVTWRLHDSLPETKLELWRTEKNAWLRSHPKPWTEKIEKEYHLRFNDRIEDWLDAGEGSCILRDAENRKIVTESLCHFDVERYDLWAFVVMPNHVHLLISPRTPHLLEQIIHSWKSYSSKMLNRRLNKSGQVWQAEYWDRLVRSEEHFQKYVRYIRRNPEKANPSPDEYTLYERDSGA